jgi:hypothetical protein
MATFKVSKINKVTANSTTGTTGEITATAISADDTSLDVTIADSEQDPDGATVFTVSRLEGELAVQDFDFAFNSTMNNGSTIESAMTGRNKIYVGIELEDGTMADSTGSTEFQVRPVAEPNMEVGTDDDLVHAMLRFTHSDHGGAQKPN